MNSKKIKEKIIAGISIIISVIVGITMFISGINWIDATTESEEGKWLFILITCAVIGSINIGIMQILSYIEKKDKRKAIEYFNKKQTYIAAGLTITGGFIVVFFMIVLIYVLALVPQKNLNPYIYPIGVIIWIGIILTFIGIFYGELTDAYKIKEQTD